VYPALSTKVILKAAGHGLVSRGPIRAGGPRVRRWRYQVWLPPVVFSGRFPGWPHCDLQCRMPLMADAARVLEEALALTADERARIAHQLIHSLEPEDADAAASWNEELRRRVDEIESGTADLEDWESVRVRLDAASRT